MKEVNMSPVFVALVVLGRLYSLFGMITINFNDFQVIKTFEMITMNFNDFQVIKIVFLLLWIHFERSVVGLPL